MNAPLVSVLLASHGHAPYVEEAVRSICSQEGVDFELLVVDDGSPDESPEILRRLADELGFALVCRENRGIVATHNELLSMARGRCVCTFSSDDVMPQGRLRAQSDFLLSRPGSAACFGQIRTIGPDGRLSPGIEPLYAKNVPEVRFEQVLLGERALHGCSEMILADALRSLGGYDPRFFFEDLPLFLALLAKFGPQPVSPDVVCCHYRLHGGNVHRDHERMYGEILRIVDLYREHPLHGRARALWKTRFFSALAADDKAAAIRLLPRLANLSPEFLLRLPKLFLPGRLFGKRR